MRKIDLTEYQVLADEGEDEEEKFLPYRVKKSLVNIMFNPALQLNGEELLARNDLARKIRSADSDILLEDSEWGQLVSAINTVRGLGEHDVEFARRILKAEVIEVEEAKS